MTDASRASEGIEDDGNRPKKLRKTLERVSTRSETKERELEDSQGRPGDEPDEPGGETAVPGDCQTSHKRPRNVRNERVTKRTRHIEIEGQEVKVSERSRETSRAIGSARATATEMRWMGDEVVRPAQ